MLFSFLIPLMLIVGCRDDYEIPEDCGISSATVEVAEIVKTPEQMMDCIVHLQVEGIEQEQTSCLIFKKNFTPKWQGSGFFKREDGIIVTAAHVVHEASQITVTLRDGRTFEAQYFWAADNMDVGFVKIDIVDAPCLEWDTDGVELAEDVYVLGHPYGRLNEWHITKGIMSCLARDTNGFFGEHLTIQTDAASWPGNSGGAVLDMDGQIVGVLVGGYNGSECLSIVTPTWIAKEWCDVFEQWLETR